MTKTVKSDLTGLGYLTGIYCTSNEYQGLLEIIKEVKLTSMIQVSGVGGEGTIIPKLPKTQQDIFIYVSKLAEKHNLPLAFYGINKEREFIKVDGIEDDFHGVYSL